MLQFRLASAIILSGLTGLAALAGGQQDPLWDKALAIAAANAEWTPGFIVTRSEVLHRGKQVAVHEIWQRSRPGPAGEAVAETVKILEDGKDVTTEEKKEMPAKPGGKGVPKGGGNPFDPAAQSRLLLKPLTQVRLIGGSDCAGYAFELRNTNGPAVKGTAWLEKGTGVPKEIANMTVDPVPDKRLKQLTTTIHYEMTNGFWFARSMEALSTVSMFLIKADLRSTTTFSEHWKKPQL